MESSVSPTVHNKPFQPRKPYGYCNLACRQTCRMVFLEVADVTQIEKPGPNEDSVVDRNEGTRNGVGDFEIFRTWNCLCW
mmetsp:Transcript_43048/g.51657  ORF Transcript_43048/g.51657 Transcript_43048/m.51657 type:complete len:80 (+) Transcript_43048:1259-1498(+)